MGVAQEQLHALAGVPFISVGLAWENSPGLSAWEVRPSHLPTLFSPSESLSQLAPSLRKELLSWATITAMDYNRLLLGAGIFSISQPLSPLSHLREERLEPEQHCQLPEMPRDCRLAAYMGWKYYPSTSHGLYRLPPPPVCPPPHRGSILTVVKPLGAPILAGKAGYKYLKETISNNNDAQSIKDTLQRQSRLTWPLLNLFACDVSLALFCGGGAAAFAQMSEQTYTPPLSASQTKA